MYQKVTGLILAIGMVFCLTACGQVAEIENPDTEWMWIQKVVWQVS